MQRVMAMVREVFEHLVRIVLSPAEPVFGGAADRPFEQMPTDNVAATYDMKRCTTLTHIALTVGNGLPVDGWRSLLVE